MTVVDLKKSNSQAFFSFSMSHAFASIERTISLLISVFFLYIDIILLIELKKNKVEVVLKKSLKNVKYAKKLLNEMLDSKNKNVVNKRRTRESSKEL